jgi:hypothetical protein
MGVGLQNLDPSLRGDIWQIPQLWTLLYFGVYISMMAVMSLAVPYMQFYRKQGKFSPVPPRLALVGHNIGKKDHRNFREHAAMSEAYSGNKYQFDIGMGKSGSSA